MKIQPVGFQVLVKLVEVEEKTEGGIITATQDQLKREQRGQYIGEIAALGNLVFAGIDGVEGRNAQERAESWGVKIGDIVQFQRYDGQAAHEAESYHLIPDKHIKAVIHE